MKIKENKKSGFTLAEVLITLAIMGVVAALTLPTMIENHQKKVLVVRLQKAISTIEQGFKMMMADDAVDNIYNTSVFERAGGEYALIDCLSVDISASGSFGSTPVDTSSDSLAFSKACSAFLEGFKKYFPITWERNTFNTSSTYYYMGKSTSLYKKSLSFSQGSILYMQFTNDGKWVWFGTTAMGSSLALYIDVNGEKGPNIAGRDLFVVPLLSDGTFDFSPTDYCDDGATTTDQVYSSGGWCGHVYLMNNGWVMDY